MTAPEHNKRTIRFNLDKNEVFQIVDDHVYDLDEIWWTSNDYNRIKEITRLDTKDWRKHGYGILLKDTYESPRNDTQDCLNAFCRLASNLAKRGLERHLSRQHGEERSEHKERCRQSVLIHQRRMKRQGCTVQEISEHLSHIYRDMTMAAKIFARRMGKADQVAARLGEDTSEADKMRDLLEAQQRVNTMDRRLSNYSSKTNGSLNSFDSRRRPLAPRKPKCPNSPATPMDEYYAAIA
jgi:hypothetical protein